ncbi:MAG: hypothetical protein ACK45C_07590, partial [Bacteroidota bacterium]
IGDFTSPYYVYTAYLYNASANNLKEVDRNTFWVNVPNQYYCMATTGYGNWSGWAGDPKAGPNNRVDNPDWVYKSKNDFRSRCFEAQNNVPTVSINTLDDARVTRNKTASDRGALEN